MVKIGKKTFREKIHEVLRCLERSSNEHHFSGIGEEHAENAFSCSNNCAVFKLISDPCFWQLEYKASNGRGLKTRGASLDVLRRPPQHMELAWFLSDPRVSNSNKLERLRALGLIQKEDVMCFNKLQGAGMDVFQYMHDQIAEARMFFGDKIVVRTFLDGQDNVSQLLPLPEFQRTALRTDRHNASIIDSIRDGKIFNVKSQGFRLATVVAHKDGKVARSFIHRADGGAAAVHRLYAVSEDKAGKITTKEHVAVKVPFGSTNVGALKSSETILQHEFKVLERLQQGGVSIGPKPYKQGLYPIGGGPQSSILIMEDLEICEEYCALLNCISTQDLIQILRSGVNGLGQAHIAGVTHGHVNKGSFVFNWCTKNFRMGGWKYSLLDGECPQNLSRANSPNFLTLEDGKFNVAEVCSSEDAKRKDFVDFAGVILELLSRSTLSITFVGDSFELEVEDGSNRFNSDNLIGLPVERVLQDLLDRFNKFVCDPSQQISTDSKLVEVIELLLVGQFQAADMELMLAALTDDLPKPDERVSEKHVPAIFCQGERELIFPLRLGPVDCFDDKGNLSQGYGAYTAAPTPHGSLVAKYLSFAVSPPVAEQLRVNGAGMHLKTTGPRRDTIYHGARLGNGIFDIDFAVQNIEVVFGSPISLLSS